jgi:hypothetical protein
VTSKKSINVWVHLSSANSRDMKTWNCHCIPNSFRTTLHNSRCCILHLLHHLNKWSLVWYLCPHHQHLISLFPILLRCWAVNACPVLSWKYLAAIDFRDWNEILLTFLRTKDRCGNARI